jgi:iron complex outermembrane recepter protein
LLGNARDKVIFFAKLFEEYVLKPISSGIFCKGRRPMRLKLHSLILALLMLFGTTGLFGQSKQLYTWKDDLAAIQNISAAELEAQRDAVAHIRTGVELWLKLHPNSTIQLQSAPPQPWNSDQISKQVSQLQRVIESILKEDPSRSFELGLTVISVTAETSPLSPFTDGIDYSEIVNSHNTNLVQSIQTLPGLSIDHKSSRNQTGIMIRGFDTRQVGIYLDGVPVYIPYDGYADLGRFLTSDIADIDVAKGYSSPLLGPNGLGGVINIVTRQPQKKLEGDALMGTGSGDMLESGLHLGSRWHKFFLRAGMDWLQTDYFPLSNDFTRNAAQPTFERLNSDQRDIRYNGRLGYTMDDENQFVFTYNKQKADYGVPTYAGNDTTNNKTKYWKWPYWNRDSYYINSNTGLGEHSALKFRAFYDRYPNGLDMFSNSTYTLQTNQGSSRYDDKSIGLSSEISSRIFPRHVLGASVFFKGDDHTEHSINFDKKNVRTIEPWRTDRDELVSLGVQDSITLSSKLRATLGFSADHLNATKAQDLDKTANKLKPFTCTSEGITGTCQLLHSWAYNPLASISYTIGQSGTAFFTFAMKSHFPTLKDRYSFKNGQAVPNPELRPEHARNYDLGYSHVLGFKTTMQIELYRSDVYDAIEQATIPAEFTNQCSSLSKTTCRKSVNVGKELHQGVELTIRSNPMRRLTLDANYTFLKRTISGPANMTGVYPTGSPKHKAVGSATVRLPHEILMLASVRYEAGTISTNDSGLVIPASKFATADLEGVVPIYGGASLQLGIKNLFDRNYYYQEGFPEAGRNWYFNARYRF